MSNRLLRLRRPPRPITPMPNAKPQELPPRRQSPISWPAAAGWTVRWRWLNCWTPTQSTTSRMRISAAPEKFI
ncbi:hypothetical protein ALQ23_02483 [Pseudomonas syringae pv. antirrhini]|nr:hypothetical protein ALQ23_02483 [Pseudomonas syringae pv. antirrhini]